MAENKITTCEEYVLAELQKAKADAITARKALQCAEKTNAELTQELEAFIAFVKDAGRPIKECEEESDDDGNKYGHLMMGSIYSWEIRRSPDKRKYYNIIKKYFTYEPLKTEESVKEDE